MALDLTGDAAVLAAQICDIPSPSGAEAALAGAIEAALSPLPHLTVERDGDAVIARTHMGRGRRVVIAGHIDTVPISGNLPTRLIDGDLWGRGTVDMKGGVAMALHLAATLTEPAWDVTWVFYDHEEVDAARNGLGRISRNHPEWLAGDFAILGEPTGAQVEGGCNGTLRVEVCTTGLAAHSARPWMGENAIHAAGALLQRLAEYEAREVAVDGLVYREALSAVAIAGGRVLNSIPDECVVTVNYRFAPSTSIEEAFAHVQSLLPGYELTLVDAAAGARPGLDSPAIQEFVDAVRAHTGGAVMPKYGWTDVARFSELGIPAVNFGPGDPLLAHADDERCPISQIHSCTSALAAWLER